MLVQALEEAAALVSSGASAGTVKGLGSFVDLLVGVGNLVQARGGGLENTLEQAS